MGHNTANMTEIVAPGGPLAPIPDDLTVPQFMLDSHHPLRPLSTGAPWLIEEETGRGIGHEELRARTFGLANELKARYSIGENDVVCLFSPNHVDWPVAVWAVHRLGAIVTPGNAAYTTEELIHQLTLTRSSLIITFSGSLPTALAAGKAAGIGPERIILIDSRPASVSTVHATLNELINEGLSKMPTFTERKLAPGEGKTKIAFFCFSSGTTGKPKAVAVQHYALMANVIQTRMAMGFEPRYIPGDTVLGILPFFHVFGLVINLHYHLWMGATVIPVKRFVFEDFLKNIQRYRIKHLQLVPPMCVLMCKSPLTKQYDLSSVRWLMSGAAPLSAEVTANLADLLPECSIGQGYGMTETFTAVAYSPMNRRVSSSAGKLVPGVTVRVVKPDGSLAKLNENGELVVKGPSMALGYWNDEAATRETFVDGWVRTGDEVMITEDYEIIVLDRIKELIKVKGFQVAPAELEGHLLNHPDVGDVCVVGKPDDFNGEVPLAFIVLSQSAQVRTAKDSTEVNRIKEGLAKYVADHKIAYKRLAGGIEFIEAIPKNPSGKLLRRVLRDRVRASASRAKTSAPARARL